MRSAIALALLLLPVPVFAWDGSPRQVAGVTSTPALVATAHDGASGAFVAWQEGAAAPIGAYTLHVTRLTPEGDAHPAWPAGGIEFGGGAAVRSALGLVPDESGGAFAWWMQAGALRVTRVLGDGSIAPGWTAAGKWLGPLTTAEHRPWVQPDGAGGLWLGVFQGLRTTMVTPSVRIAHLGADGQGGGLWPATPRAVPLRDDVDEWVYSASFAPASDGGAWVLVATGTVVEPDFLPGQWRLARFTPAGLPDPAYPPEGVVLEPFEADQIGGAVPRIGIGAVTADDAGGVFVALGRVTAAFNEWQPSWFTAPVLQRRLADGTLHAQQPAFSNLGNWWEESGGCFDPWSCPYADYSLLLTRDAAGSLVAGATTDYVHVGPVLTLTQLDESGGVVDVIGSASGSGVAIHPASGSGFVVATFDPTGPTSSYDPGYAYVGCSQTGKSGYYRQETFSPYSAVYTDTDAAPLPDGGALLVWARALDPAGLYAIRVAPDGSPLAVEPGASPARGVRLVREGAALRAEWDAGAAGALTLHDVAGRVRARLEVAEGAGSAVFAPAAPLAPGVYFARLARTDGTNARARAVVLR